MILRDQPCVFVPAKGSRSSFSAGMREFVKPAPTALLDDVLDLEILPGDQAEFTWTTNRKVMVKTFTVDAAELKAGVIASRWFLTLSRIQTP